MNSNEDITSILIPIIPVKRIEIPAVKKRIHVFELLLFIILVRWHDKTLHSSPHSSILTSRSRYRFSIRASCLDHGTIDGRGWLSESIFTTPQHFLIDYAVCLFVDSCVTAEVTAVAVPSQAIFVITSDCEMLIENLFFLAIFQVSRL